MKLLHIISVMMTSSFLYVHQTTAVPCNNPIIPTLGLEMMLQGVDITEIDQFPIVKSTTHQSAKANILKFTCIEGRNWWDVESDKEYDLPYQVRNPQTSCIDSRRVDLLRTNQSIAVDLAREAGTNGEYQQFSSISTASFVKLQDDIKDTSKLIATGIHRTQDVTILFEKFEMSLEALSYINKSLAEPFESNVNAYLNFLKKYGTHYRTDGMFGGAVKSYIEISSTYSSGESDEEIRKMVKLHLEETTGATTDKKVPASFKNSIIKETVVYYGGLNEYKTAKKYKDWKQSTKQKPWFYSTKLVPIYELVEDNTTRVEIKKAINFYLAKKKLIPFLEKNVIEKKLSNELINDMLFKLLDKNDINEPSELKIILKQIDYQLKLPTWFKTKPQLCFAMHGTGDCYSKEECSTINHRLRDLYEITGSHSKCEMTWKIKADEEIPKYFKNTQICMRYLSSGGMLCNGYKVGDMCSPVNRPITYIDHQRNWSGNCMQSWKINVPDDSPIWLKTIQLCFYWNHNKDPSKCAGLPKRLCSVAGTWTEYYYDKTVGVKKGGCFMTFGWRTADHTVPINSKPLEKY